MKADGIEYEERMELLEEVTYPKPLADLLEAAYEIYRHGHPWVADHELAPKSVARDMYERAMTFTEYVGFYGLARSEGMVLRYLADAYKALRQTVPEEARTEELHRPDRVARRAGPAGRLQPARRVGAAAQPRGRGRAGGGRSRRAAAGHRATSGRSGCWSATRCSAGWSWPRWQRYEELGELDADAGWDADAWADALEPYFAEHDEIGTGADARGPALLMIDEQPGRWAVRQIFDDPAGDHDWGISAEVDLAASDEAGAAVVEVTSVGQL